MARPRSSEDPLPALYATVLPGLEAIAAEEITRDLGGDVKKTDRGVVVFRVDSIGPELLELRTVEDVFLLGWGSDSLSYRATDLVQIRRWTAKDVDWQRMLRLHHLVHPKPKGKPTYRLVSQMTGTHGYRRVDALKAMADGLQGVFPASWRHADENAAVEVWLTIHGATAVCGMRLSDRTMRHRIWKTEHFPASLRPTVAAAMVRLAGAAPEQLVLDPMTGAGTILGEQLELARQRRFYQLSVWGGDHDLNALRAAETNIRKLGQSRLFRWDARRLPLASEVVDRLVSNPPFGKQLSTPEEIEGLYRSMVKEADRVLKPGGRAVYLVSEMPVLRDAIAKVRWQPMRQVRIEVLGQPATISVWQKPNGPDRVVL